MPFRPNRPRDFSGQQPQEKLLSRDFILLFCMSMCCNSYLAVFYCFEQWLEGLAVSPNWRGILLASLAAMVLLFRPVASVVFLKRNKLPPLLCTIILSSCVMLAYPLVPKEHVVGMVWTLRIVQGISLAVYSCCVVAVMVSCIPKGQSARGFALFSLTTLLPYSIIPAVGERILPLLGGEPYLFAATAMLGVPALCMLLPLAPKLRASEIPPAEAEQLTARKLIHAASHSGLAFIYLGCLTFSIMVSLAIYFIKGLCVETGARPEWFFLTYTITMILIRLFGGHLLDTLPRYRVVPICALTLVCCLLGLAWAPRSLFFLCACFYGISLGLLYPLLAATVYDRSTPETRSINSNVMMLTFDASGMIGPLLGGAVVNAGWGYRGVFSTAALLIAACGASMVLDRLRLAWWEHKDKRQRLRSWER